MLIKLEELSIADRQNYLQHAIAPRPICFASTIDKNGNVNLSPFSFFNLFSSNPPIVIFSPARRVRDNTTKHSLENVIEVPEVAINIVDFDMVQQTSLASCEYPKEIDEFVKAGFTAEKSQFIKPPLVKESKIKLECVVKEVKSLGEGGGAGNLVICEVICMHIDDSILDENKKITQTKINHVARLGADWYCRVDETNLFKVPKPNTELGLGMDSLPESIRLSKILSANDLAQLANMTSIPDPDPNYEDEKLRQIVQYYSLNPEDMDREVQLHAKNLIEEGKLHEAWQVLQVSF